MKTMDTGGRMILSHGASPYAPSIECSLIRGRLEKLLSRALFVEARQADRGHMVPSR